MTQIKLCIAGKNNIAVDVLEYIIKSGMLAREEIVVVCNRTETGKNSWQKSLRFFAKLWGIKEVSLDTIYSIKDVIFLSLEFDRIIHPNRFQTNKLYNIHFSLLPKYKGCYTAIMPILNGEIESGVSFHRMNAGIDTGEIVAQKKFSIGAMDTARDLYYKCLANGTDLVISQLPKLKAFNGDLPGESQSPFMASYYAKDSIDFSNISINLKKTAAEIHSQIKAFTFREYQLPVINGKNVVKSEITEIQSREKAGTIIWQDKWRAVMATIDYDIVLYWDAYEYVMHEAAAGNTDNLSKVPQLACYVNEGGVHGWTPLIVAAYNGHYETFMLLIANGANLNQRNWNGTTLLMYAKDGWRNNGDSRIFSYLRSRGASLEDADYSGRTIRDYCADEEWKKLVCIE